MMRLSLSPLMGIDPAPVEMHADPRDVRGVVAVEFGLDEVQELLRRKALGLPVRSVRLNHLETQHGAHSFSRWI